jgi:anti-anti-sigma factor
MDIITERRGSICILRLRGRFTLADTEAFGRSRAAARAWQPAATIVDVREVPYMDSTAIGYLLGFYTSSARLGEGFAVIHLNERILELLRLSHLHTVLPIYDDEETALAELESQPRRKPAGAP